MDKDELEKKIDVTLKQWLDMEISYRVLLDQLLALVDPDEIPVEAEVRKQEKYNEAILLVGEVAGLNQSLFTSQDVISLSDRAEEILKTLKEE